MAVLMLGLHGGPAITKTVARKPPGGRSASTSSRAPHHLSHPGASA
jgi:hypothetical protein